MRYYGNKTKLLPFIEKVVKKTGINVNSTFVDLFSGTSAVGKHFKKLGYKVYSNDNLEFAYTLSKTFIELNELPKFIRLKKELSIKENKKIFDYLNNLKPTEEGFIFQNYSPNGGRKYFSDENALKIDTIRKQIHDWKQNKIINELEYYYLITSLLRAVNLVSNVSGTYAAFLKNWDKRALKPLILKEVEIIPSTQRNKAFKQDANKLIKNLNADILYLDPPYNTRQYASNYFILELIAEGWFDKKPKIYGKTGMREYKMQKSKYCSKLTATSTLSDLIQNVKAKCLILSYNNEGILQKKDILEILSKLGNVEVFESEHKRYRSINQDENDSNRTFERIYLVNPVKKSIKRANQLTGRQWLQNSFSIWRDLGKNEEERKLKHPAIFTIKLVSKLIDTFTNHKKSVILDCFAGSGTSLIVGLLKGMNVIGFDINPNFKQLFLERIQNYYLLNFEQAQYEYFVHNSRHLSDKLDLNAVDLCITSPPYWDILNRKRTADFKKNINYTDSPEDLGNIKNYNKFLNSLKEIFNEVHKVLKPKCYFIVIVMDLRKKSEFYPLHIDVANIAKEIGFKFEDIIIWDRHPEYNNMRPLGYPYKFIINKVHEYLLIFRKV